ncbi:glycosyltransferase [Shewanella xiamenensis]|uniref:glycosyltransferase n=1 Tax=Shewanella xiamenensis TaxID=332186 RepID=UPI00313F025D
MCKVTIIIPTFNSEDTIIECIESIIEVSGDLLGSVIQVIICDGASTDNTLDFIQAIDVNGLNVFSYPDNGIYDAMNNGVSRCVSDWVYFLGSDDILMPEFINLLDRIDCNKFIYYGNVVLKSTGFVYDGQFSKYKLIRKNINHQSIIYPRHLLVKYPFSTKYKILSDWNTNIILFDNFKYLPFITAAYNDVSGVSSTKIDDDFMRDKIIVIKKHMSYLCYLYAILIKMLGKLKNEFKM